MPNRAKRRYAWRIGVATAGYIATLLLAEYLIDDRGVVGSMAVAVALLPGLCIAGIFWAIARFLVEQQDEYQRMLLIRQILVATGLTMTVTTLWAMLETYRLVAHFDAFYLVMLFFVGLGLGAVVNKLTLGDSGGC